MSKYEDMAFMVEHLRAQNDRLITDNLNLTSELVTTRVKLKKAEDRGNTLDVNLTDIYHRFHQLRKALSRLSLLNAEQPDDVLGAVAYRAAAAPEVEKAKEFFRYEG